MHLDLVEWLIRRGADGPNHKSQRKILRTKGSPSGKPQVWDVVGLHHSFYKGLGNAYSLAGFLLIVHPTNHHCQPGY
ncbi:hypothetical protein COLO4_26914 [Corchorus olitorius]|uniref:Uncharacterized protein n=1 Tax=Corchorus olitorius TaxID=93759 RepID=A0A1R3HTY1_9ROSI|nr:hypothetical protein COLO4_26914 [Corchorus olitorius]